MDNKQIRQLINISLILLSLFIIVKCVNSCGDTPTVSSSSDNKIEAYLNSEIVIKRFLKAPSTAEFCGYHHANVQQNGNDYTVTGYVNSQNSFSAMIRADYEVTLKYEADKWSIEALTFEGKKIK